MLTRSEHITEHTTELGWKRRAWGALLNELSTGEKVMLKSQPLALAPERDRGPLERHHGPGR